MQWRRAGRSGTGERRGTRRKTERGSFTAAPLALQGAVTYRVAFSLDTYTREMRTHERVYSRVRNEPRAMQSRKRREDVYSRDRPGNPRGLVHGESCFAKALAPGRSSTPSRYLLLEPSCESPRVKRLGPRGSSLQSFVDCLRDYRQIKVSRAPRGLSVMVFASGQCAVQGRAP